VEGPKLVVSSPMAVLQSTLKTLEGITETASQCNVASWAIMHFLVSVTFTIADNFLL
jgi:hypothetical protein